MFKMFKKRKQNDIHEFQPLLVEIEDRPLNPLGRSILWIILAVMLFGSLWLFFAKIDVVVSARGKVIPQGEIKILQPIEKGIITKIFVKECEKVHKGQVLMQIDPSVTKTSLESKEKDMSVTNMEIARLEALVKNKKFRYIRGTDKTIYAEQYDQYEQQKNTFSQNMLKINMKEEQAVSQLNSAKSDAKRVQDLLDVSKARLEKMKKVLDIIAQNDYEEVLKNIHNFENQHMMAQSKIVELQKHILETKQEAKVYKYQMYSQWFKDLTQKQKERRDLVSQINAISFQNKKQQIISPTDGHVGKLLINTESGVVTPAEKLISIIPENVPLIVKATVLNQDIGFIKQGMKCTIKVDTFSFQKYGSFDGNVTAIAHDAIDDKKLGPVYEVKIMPKQKALLVEGEYKPLEPGMSVTTEIKIGRRRVIEFFIYPLIKYMDEGLSVR
ncbi:HlyD family type I secretion periplasmic adaptor subunit [Sulfurospirillum sp. 1612]|uniref:HlyD family type I secretion periplasmic adaptor subunit n=1 Tax=Sulfurospirillum sp. 1612 TaxID=3094835 RepID=UPI002F95C086